MPGEFSFRVLHADPLLRKSARLADRLPVTSQFVRTRLDKHCELWREGALRQLFNPANDNYDFPSAERLAIAKEFSEQSLALNPPDAVLREG